MENLIFLLVMLLMHYLTITICFWYFLHQSINNLQVVAKGNFRDAKIRDMVRKEITYIEKDKKEAYKWPKFVYEILKYEYKEYKLRKEINDTSIKDTENNKDS